MHAEPVHDNFDHMKPNDNDRTISATLSALVAATGVGWSSWATDTGQHFNPPERSSLYPFTVDINALRMMAARASYWDTLRVLAGATPQGDDQATLTPAGLTLSADQTLLNWQGENYVRQSGAQEELAEAAEQIRELETENTRLRAEYAKLLQARETIDPLAETTYERDRAEAVELVEAMVAGAGFELLRDGGDAKGAMWQQKLDTRPGVQIFLTVPEGILAAGPANVFAFVKANVGVAQ